MKIKARIAELRLIRKDLWWPDSSPSSAMVSSMILLSARDTWSGKGCDFTWAFLVPASHLQSWDTAQKVVVRMNMSLSSAQYLANEE